MNRVHTFALMSALVAATGGCSDDEPNEVPNEMPVIYTDIAFPELAYESKFIEVDGAMMHYIEAGDPDGPVVVLTHGWPSWSYIWRNVIPELESSGRIIAFDLIGFGKSSKLLDNNYSFAVQQRFFEGFMEALDLRDIVLVLHDWGSGIGFDYAATHEENIRGLVYFEAMMPPRLPFASFADGFPGNPQGAQLFESWRTPGVGEEILLNQSAAIEGFLPNFQLRTLTEDEIDAYRAPWPTPESRWPLWWVPNQLPVAGEPANVERLIVNYIEWLQRTDTPMLQFAVTPGLTGQADVVEWSQTNIQNLTTVDLGPGVHFVQEDYPTELGQGIADWVEGLTTSN